MQVLMHGCRNLSVTFNGDHYELIQFHFHSPSEHEIGGSTYDGEAHLSTRTRKQVRGEEAAEAYICANQEGR